MISNRRKTVLVIMVFCLSAFLIFNALFFGGMIFDRNGGFERSRAFVLEDILKEGQSAEVWLADNVSKPVCHIPLVCCVYGIEPPPYAITIEITDKTESLEKLVVESVCVEYSNGIKVNHDIGWQGEFESSSILTSVDGRSVETPANQFSGSLPVTVDRRQNCRIRFVGYFTEDNNVKIPFDTFEDFEYEEHKWRVWPGRRM